MEPNEYFKELKSKINTSTNESFENQLKQISNQLIKARELGQKTYLHKLAFVYNTIAKEQLLLSEGFDKYVYRNDIINFIDNVKPKNSIKIIELKRYPRSIPDSVIENINKVKSLNVFDEIVVVFTDLTGERYQTPEEKKFVEKNRDPIVFGLIQHEKSGLKHERLYFIDDWEDEYCELTFSKMIEEMSRQTIKKPSHTIDTTNEYLNEVSDIVSEAFEEIEHSTKIKRESWFKRLFNKLFKW